MPDFTPKIYYDRRVDNPLEDFYRPALKDAVFYQRMAGFFSSTSFFLIADEIIDLIKREGRMQLITSPHLSARDRAEMTKSVVDDQILTDTFLDDLRDDPDKGKVLFYKLMGYMLKHKIDGKPQLEIKIAIPNHGGAGIWHLKKGLIHYENNKIICFDGSNNETGLAWSQTGNFESFWAFSSCGDDKDREAIGLVKDSFDDHWNDEVKELKVVTLPVAVREKLLEISPESTREFHDTIAEADEYIQRKKRIKKDPIEEPNETEEEDLKDHQSVYEIVRKTALEKWVENKHRGILAMATGTGKTFTGFACVDLIHKLEERHLTVIAVPYTHLVEQWKDALDDYNRKISNLSPEETLLCYGEKKWRPKMEGLIKNFNYKNFSDGKTLVNNCVIFVTHATLNSDDFKKYILEFENTKKFLIVDEVHEIGSELNRNALLEEYDYRLGLSATPSRHYDEEGTAVLLNYFNGVVYELGIKEAIERKILCQYEYYPILVELTAYEMEVYDKLTRMIAAEQSGSWEKAVKPDKDENSTDPATRRSHLVAAAENKLKELERIIDEFDKEEELHEGKGLKQTLIYCTSFPSPSLPPKSPTQLVNVQNFLSGRSKKHKSITFVDKTKDRRKILDSFANGHYDCITAVKCLDQGVDIPSVEKAIIMASSGNPKQYIQRRGRVLRTSPETEKEKAIIYDILVQSPPPDENHPLRKRDRKLVAKELLRHKKFAEDSMNEDDAIAAIQQVADLHHIPLDELSFDWIDKMYSDS